MKVLDLNELKKFIEGNKILHGSPEHPGIMLSPSGEIIKSFFRRKTISTSTFFPQAIRFESNSRKLCELGIIGPIVKEIIYCKEVPVHMVIYDRLEGVDLRELSQNNPDSALTRLPGYLADLHAAGIFFRAIHLGNILVQNDEMSLIDISDLKTQNSPLGSFQRARNLAHLFNSELDKDFFLDCGLNQFIDEYIQASGLSGMGQWFFLYRLKLALDNNMAEAVRNTQAI
jgi:hypothetical protein